MLHDPPFPLPETNMVLLAPRLTFRVFACVQSRNLHLSPLPFNCRVMAKNEDTLLIRDRVNAEVEAQNKLKKGGGPAPGAAAAAAGKKEGGVGGGKASKSSRKIDSSMETEDGSDEDGVIGGGVGGGGGGGGASSKGFATSKIVFPFSLKKRLVEDWEHVTQK